FPFPMLKAGPTPILAMSAQQSSCGAGNTLAPTLVPLAIWSHRGPRKIPAGGMQSIGLGPKWIRPDARIVTESPDRNVTPVFVHTWLGLTKMEVTLGAAAAAGAAGICGTSIRHSTNLQAMTRIAAHWYLAIPPIPHPRT